MEFHTECELETKDIDYKKIFKEQLEVPPGTFMDCYAFSIHKAGSTLMHKMIADVCRMAKIPGISIPDTLFREGVFEKDWADDPRVLELITPGRIYYGFRHLPPALLSESLQLKYKRSVLLIRDPRDALVSQYFSFGGKHISHKLPDKNKEAFIEKAKKTEDLTIDEYVLMVARNHLNKLIAYRDNLYFDNVLLRKYEDIYFDKRKFLGEIFRHFGIKVPPKVLDAVAERNDIRPEEEDPTKHIRKGTPGDHANKLRPETIGKLNDMFRRICKWYGYELV